MVEPASVITWGKWIKLGLELVKSLFSGEKRAASDPAQKALRFVVLPPECFWSSAGYRETPANPVTMVRTVWSVGNPTGLDIMVPTARLIFRKRFLRRAAAYGTPAVVTESNALLGPEFGIVARSSNRLVVMFVVDPALPIHGSTLKAKVIFEDQFGNEYSKRIAVQRRGP